jgi:hypothetical protein
MCECTAFNNWLLRCKTCFTFTVFLAYFPYFEKKKRRLMRSPCSLSVYPSMPLHLSVLSHLIIVKLHILYYLYFAIFPRLLSHLGLTILKHFPKVCMCVLFMQIIIFLHTNSSFTLNHFLHKSCFILFCL